MRCTARTRSCALSWPAAAWQRVSAGPGAKGPRWYDWALIDVTDPAVTEGGGPYWLLIRRRISDGEYAFYRAHAPRPVPLAELVHVAGSRWRTEDGFAAGKELAALDEHQVRSWTSWHRWTVLALLGPAFLTVLAAAQACHYRRRALLLSAYLSGHGSKINGNALS